jgi:hypothetical protein
MLVGEQMANAGKGSRTALLSRLRRHAAIASAQIRTAKESRPTLLPPSAKPETGRSSKRALRHVNDNRGLRWEPRPQQIVAEVDVLVNVDLTSVDIGSDNCRPRAQQLADVQAIRMWIVEPGTDGTANRERGTWDVERLLANGVMNFRRE